MRTGATLTGLEIIGSAYAATEASHRLNRGKHVNRSRRARFWDKAVTGKAISETISGARERISLCQLAMLCRAIGAFVSENNTAGFELPIRK